METPKAMTADDVLREMLATCRIQTTMLDDMHLAMASRIAADAAELARVRGELAAAERVCAAAVAFFDAQAESESIPRDGDTVEELAAADEVADKAWHELREAVRALPEPEQTSE